MVTEFMEPLRPSGLCLNSMNIYIYPPSDIYLTPAISHITERLMESSRIGSKDRPTAHNDDDDDNDECMEHE